MTLPSKPHTVIRCYWPTEDSGEAIYVDLIRRPDGDWALVNDANAVYTAEGIEEFDRIEVLAEGVDPYPWTETGA